MHELKIEIPTNQPKTIYESIKPELKSSPSKKSKINLKKQKNSITLSIQSRDVSSFRAAMNSWLRWIQVAEESTEINKKD